MAPKRGSKAPRVAPATSAPRGGKRAREEDTEVVPSTDAKRGRIAKSGLVVVADKKWPTLDARKGQLVALSAAESEAWLGKAAAREASMRLGSGDLLRLVGTMEMTLSTPRGGSAYWPRSHCGALRTPAHKWGKNAPGEWWDQKTGDALMLPSCSIAALVADGAAPESEEDIEVLSALASLSTPDDKLWSTPLLVTLAELTQVSGELVKEEGEEREEGEEGEEAPGAGGSSGGRGKAPAKAAAKAKGQGKAAAKSAGSKAYKGKSVTHVLRCGVYVSRLYFETNGGKLSRILLNRLLAVRPPARPLSLLPAAPVGDTFARSKCAAATFSPEHLLHSAENTGYREAVQPAGLALKLLRYQKQTVAWLQDMEDPKLLPAGMNGLFWEERSFADGGTFFYSPQLGEARLERPPVVWGGMLCEEMGLGKTVEIVALVLSSRGKGPTLIVVPEELLGQWEQEITKSTLPQARLLVRTVGSSVHAGKQARGTERAETAPVEWSTQQLQGADVVLASYSELERRYELGQVKWYRVCLDEMQHVRSPTTRVAKTAERLHADRRWLVSGTPLYTGIDDLRGELNFLQVSPFGAAHEDGFWHWCVQGPWERKEEEVLETLSVLLSGLMMRHSKAQTDLGTGLPILQLPTQTVRYVSVPLSACERAVYEFVESAVAGCALARTEAGLTLGGGGGVGAGGAFAHGRGRQVGASAVEQGLKLLREVVGSACLLGGGGGAAQQLQVLHALELLFSGGMDGHDYARFMHTGGAGDGVSGGGLRSPLDGIRAMPPSAVIRELTRGVDVNDSMAHRRMAGGAGMVRYGGQATTGVHERNRARAAVSDVASEMRRLAQRREQLHDRIACAKGGAARGRWRWAVEVLTCSSLKYKPWLDSLRADAPEIAREKGEGGVGGESSRFWNRVWRVRGRILSGLQQALLDAEAEAEAAVGAGGVWREEKGGKETHGLFGGGSFALLSTRAQGAQGSAQGKGSAFQRTPRRAAARKASHANEDEEDSEDGNDVEEGGGEVPCVPCVRLQLRMPLASAPSHLPLGAPAPPPSQPLPFPPFPEAPKSEGNKARKERIKREQAVRVANRPPPPRLHTLAPAGWRPPHRKAAMEAEKKAGREAAEQIAQCEREKWGKGEKGGQAGGSTEQARSEPDEEDEEGGEEEGEKEGGESDSEQVGGKAATAAKVGRGKGAGRGLEREWNDTHAHSPHEHRCCDGCAKIDAVEHAAEVLARAHSARAALPAYTADIAALQEYEAKLAHADTHQLTLNEVEQRGFSELLGLARGESLSATCPICFDTIGTCGPTVIIIGCAHMTCKGCMAAHVAFTRAMRGSQAQTLLEMQNQTDATCALCRRAFLVSDLIEILEQPQEPAAGSPAAAAEGGGEEGEEGEAALTAPQAAASSEGEGGAPAYCPAATREQYNSRDAAPVAFAQPRSLPSLPLFDARFLGQLWAASGLPAPSPASTPQPSASRSMRLRALLNDLAPILEQGEKAVVFTAHKEMIEHVARTLAEEGIGYRKVCAAAGRREAQARAVSEWASSPSLPVFLLHAGVAAAGLTLVAAHHVFVLDVLPLRAEELQALNRCHRIGQQHSVECTVYYAPCTVEERLLAFRNKESQTNPTATAHSAQAHGEGSAQASGSGAGGSGVAADADALSVLAGSRAIGSRAEPLANNNKLEFALGVIAPPPR